MEEQLYNMPRIGEAAPAFEASTTQGKISFPTDFKNKWVILFSHPSDFTPVCTSEFMTFATMTRQFEALNCQLIGLSVDGLASHIAWLRTIKEKIEYRGMKHVDVTFPLIDDLTMKVARQYGMIHPGASSTAAVRAVFFIDPKGTIRTILYYPMALGRNFDEIKRILVGLQTADNFGVALPADWRPGDDVIVPTAPTMKVAADRMDGKEGAMKCYDWFFCTRTLSKDEVEKKLAGAVQK
jgi:peroxiredoxin (alkyl hydroperoxide reductase subunit C)